MKTDFLFSVTPGGVSEIRTTENVSPGPGSGMGPETMGYYVLCRIVHTAPGRGTEPDPLSPIVPVRFPVPVPFPFPFPFPCRVNVSYSSFEILVVLTL